MAEIYVGLIVLISCCFQPSVQLSHPPEELFSMTADDLFESNIGDVHEVHQQLLNRLQKDPHERVSYILNNTKKQTPSTTQRRPQFTPIVPIDLRSTISMDELKLRMKKNEINRILRSRGTLIPNFKEGEDDPLLLTRRQKSMTRAALTESPHLRQVYYYYHEGKFGVRHENGTRIRTEKKRVREVMDQIVYMTRYKMSIMTDLRRKYKGHIRYQMGYLFALLRLVQYQQKVLYNTIKRYKNYTTDAGIPNTFLFKILKLDIDLKDICRYILRLNYEHKVQEDPNYYDEVDAANQTQNNVPEKGSLLPKNLQALGMG